MTLPRTILSVLGLVSAALVLAGGADIARGQCQANELVKLTASDATEGDHFGISASISGELAVIGADGDDDVGSDAGSAYVYHFDGTTWIEQVKLTASDAAPGDNFGNAVSVSGDVAVSRRVRPTAPAVRRTSSRATRAALTTGARSPSSPPPMARRTTGSAPLFPSAATWS